MTFADGIAHGPGLGKPHILHLDRLLRSHSQLRPEAVAIQSPGLPAMVYRELRLQADRTAAALRAAGIGRRDRVAVALPDGPSAAVALLGVTCAAVAAPLDPSARAAEFDFALTDMDAKAVLVEKGSGTMAAAVARAQGRRVIELAARAGGPAGAFDLVTGDAEASPAAAIEPRAGDTALVLHTSGTTGRPKLVALTHDIVCTSARNISISLNLGERDRCLNVLPLFHGHGLMSPLLATLWAGASVVCPPGLDAPAFPGWLEEFSPTWYTAVPVIHQAILGVVANQLGVLRRCPLRFVRSASAPLPPELLGALERTLAVPVIDSYGMTEACSIITSNPLPPRSRKPGSVGVSVGNDIAVMGEKGELLPAGATGEIVLRGPTVISGYAHDPDADASAFRNGWFRTGDTGYLDEDGFLFVTGRIKEIINRGGTKISPAEVDKVLLAHPAIAEAAAFPLAHATLGEEVAAAIVVREQAAIGDEEIQAFLATRLAAQKIPRKIFRVTAIPRTTTGKVQRAELAEHVVPSRKRRPDEPETPLETKIARIWAELLGIGTVGTHEHFFDLGGNSLLIRQVQARLHEVTGRDIPVVELFAHPTIKSLSGYLARAEHATQPHPDHRDQSQMLAQGGRRLAQQLERVRRGGDGVL